MQFQKSMESKCSVCYSEYPEPVVSAKSMAWWIKNTQGKLTKTDASIVICHRCIASAAKEIK